MSVVFLQVSASHLLLQFVDMTVCIRYESVFCGFTDHNWSSQYQTRPFFQPMCDLQPHFCRTLCRQKIISVHSSHIYALDNHPNNLNIGNGAILPAQSQTLSLQMIHYWTKTAPVSAFWASSNQFKRQFSMIFPGGHFWAIFCHYDRTKVRSVGEESDIFPSHPIYSLVFDHMIKCDRHITLLCTRVSRKQVALESSDR